MLLPLCFLHPRQTQATIRQARQPMSPESIKVCDPEIGSAVGSVTFKRARELFLNLGFSMTSVKRDVVRVSDIVGSIAVYGTLGKWIYITNAELWYDPEREVAGYARLQGILHNGQVAEFDIRDQMPEGFRPVQNWSEIGNVVLKDIDDKMHRVNNLAFEVTSDGSLMNKSHNLIRQVPDGSWVPADFGVPICNARGTITCFGGFCAAACTKTGTGDCHCNYYLGVCTTAPGLSCGGDCDPGYTCKLLTPNPGSLFCGCSRPFSDQ